MDKNIVTENKTMKCFQCKHWKAVVQESATPDETYTQIIRERNNFGKVLGACVAFEKSYPMFDIESCILKPELQHVAERI